MRVFDFEKCLGQVVNGTCTHCGCKAKVVDNGICHAYVPVVVPRPKPVIRTDNIIRGRR